MFRNLWSYLCGITVDCLTSCNDQIIINVSKCTGNGCRSSPCICSSQNSVSNKNTIVSSHSHSFAKNFFCFWKSHGKNGNFCTILLFDAKCCFQTSFVIRVHNCKHCTTVKCTIRIKFYSTFCIRYLFNTYYYFHDMNLLISTSFQR